MDTLKDLLLEPGTRPQVVQDCVRLIDDEVRAKSGLGGVAVKGGYAIVKKVKPGIIPEAVDNLLDDFVDKLEPFFAEFGAQQSPIASFFGRRETEIANALLAITDGRAQHSKHKALRKAYEKLRPTGVKHTAAAVPAIARLVAKHARVA